MSPIVNRDGLLCADAGGWRSIALRLVEAALDAVEPRRATLAALGRAEADGARLRGCIVLALGKASRGMARAAVERCSPSRGLVVGPDAGHVGPLPMRAGSHPLPDMRSLQRGREVLALARSASEGDTVLCLLSGGASAMVELPVSGVRIAAFAELSRSLLEGGAPIQEINAVRRALSCIKGGRLAEAVRPARLVNVVISDVPGVDPSAVASGPTMATGAGIDAREVVRRRCASARLPVGVREALAAPRAEVPAAAFQGVRTYVAADNDTACRAMVETGARLGLSLARLPGYLGGEARSAGAEVLRAARSVGGDGVVWGGETVVHVRAPGRGGRNQELVLGAVGQLDRGLLLSIGTDGVDGKSDAAGALLDGAVIEAAAAAGVDAARFLDRNDSASFFEAAGGAIVTGPTGTNVADVCLVLGVR